ncbi:MAG: MucR family transcriptional regulator [Alphaproteobacteria bacterium]|nr:MAG: MucR family transcriptional regulator [Alphaproteobacteria bacterium]
MFGNSSERLLSGKPAETCEEALAAAATVTAAFAGRNDATVEEIVALAAKLLRLFSAGGSRELETAKRPGRQAGSEVTPIAPAVPIEAAVREDKVTCLCCGKSFTMLKRHLRAEHGLSEDDYRALFSLPEDFPLVAPSYSARKAAYARRAGLGKYERKVSPASS